nr:hypothetical protein [Natronococcus sp. AD5]
MESPPLIVGQQWLSRQAKPGSWRHLAAETVCQFLVREPTGHRHRFLELQSIDQPTDLDGVPAVYRAADDHESPNVRREAYETGDEHAEPFPQEQVADEQNSERVLVRVAISLRERSGER